MGSQKENPRKMDAPETPNPQTIKWRSLSPDSWWFSDEGLYVSNIESFKKRHEQCQKSKWIGWFLHPETERKGRSTYLILFSGPQESSCCSFKYLEMREAFLEAKHSTCLEGSRQQQNSSLSPFLKGGQSPVTRAGLRQGAKLRGLGTGNLSANQNASPPVL